MSRKARLVLPGLPHHVTQRGNRRQQTFFEEGDFALYKHILSEQCRFSQVELWAYCLMPNHVHLLLVPSTQDALTEAIRETHRRYTAFINRREDWVGYLWQGRYGSQPLTTDASVLNAARYIERNPVEAGLVQHPEDWKWSSARAHLYRAEDPPLISGALLALAPDWRGLLE